MSLAFADAPRFWAMRKELHGNALSEALDIAGLNAEQLARKLNTAGYRTEKGKEYNYDYIWNRINDRLVSSPHFIGHIRAVLKLKEDWPSQVNLAKKDIGSGHLKRLHSLNEGVGPTSTPTREVPLLPPVGARGLKETIATFDSWSSTIVIPDFLGGVYPAVPIVDDAMQPVAQRGDFLLVKVGEFVRAGKTYAITHQDGSGEYRKAFLIEGRTLLASINPAQQPISPESVFVDALVVGILPQYVPGFPHGTVNAGGVDFADWPVPERKTTEN